MTCYHRLHISMSSSSDEDTKPMITPTVELRIREIEMIVGEFPFGAKARLAKALVKWRDDDYILGKNGRPMSQTMPAVYVPDGIKK